RVLLLEHAVLVQDTQELAVVRLLPVAARSLPLLDDRLDGLHRRGKVGDGDQRRPPEVLLGGLGLGWTDEDLLLTVAGDKVPEALLDPTIEVADGGEVLLLRHNLVEVHGWCWYGRAGHLESGRVGERHALGAFQVEE